MVPKNYDPYFSPAGDGLNRQTRREIGNIYIAKETPVDEVEEIPSAGMSKTRKVIYICAGILIAAAVIWLGIAVLSDPTGFGRHLPYV